MTSETSPLPKRRVLYIRHKRIKKDSPHFVTTLQDEWPQALGLHADVTTISDDFDYSEVCDKINPDFVLYESGWLIPAPLHITNMHARPEIPRIALASFDPHDTSRGDFLRYVDHMNIQWILSHMTEAVTRIAPELEGRVYSISQFIDPEIYHDYGLEKDTPVSIFGGYLEPELYYWRARTIPEILQCFPTLVYKHPGYENPIPRHHFPITGSAFAKAINRSHFSLADTTRFDCLLRKHLEIPASGAVLVAPDTASLKPYGFKDMHNCILGSGKKLYTKIGHVADHPELYETIRKNGYDLVHNHFRRQDWRGVVDFYECLRTLKPGQTIQQQGILGPFIAVHGNSHTPSIATTYQDSEFSAVMKRAQEQILSGGSLDDARESLRTLLGWVGHLVEPSVPLAIISLLQGRAQDSKKILLIPQHIRKERDRLEDYDPVEIAYLSLTAALTGDDELLNRMRREMKTMNHVSLRRLEWLGIVLASGGDASHPPENVLSHMRGDRFSTHWMGSLPIDQWLSLMVRILTAHGQGDLLKIHSTQQRA